MSHEEEKDRRSRRKETRSTLGSKMHIAPRWIVQKLDRTLISPIASHAIAEDRRERCLSHPVFLTLVLKLEAGKVDGDCDDYNV